MVSKTYNQIYIKVSNFPTIISENHYLACYIFLCLSCNHSTHGNPILLRDVLQLIMIHFLSASSVDYVFIDTVFTQIKIPTQNRWEHSMREHSCDDLKYTSIPIVLYLQFHYTFILFWICKVFMLVTENSL